MECKLLRNATKGREREEKVMIVTDHDCYVFILYSYNLLHIFPSEQSDLETKQFFYSLLFHLTCCFFVSLAELNSSSSRSMDHMFECKLHLISGNRGVEESVCDLHKLFLTKNKGLLPLSILKKIVKIFFFSTC